MKTDPRPSPRAEVERAKAALVSGAQVPTQHPAVRLVKEHPVPAVGAAFAVGFLIVVFKPGRQLMRQAMMAGTSVILRKAILKYLGK